MRTLLSFALLAAAPAAAHAGEPIRTSRDGYQLEYMVTPQADGSKLIAGRELTQNVAFSFLVKGRKVTGEVGGRDVRFSAPQTKPRAVLIASN
jgi:hypothetical protein